MPDGRTVHAQREAPTADWIVDLDGTERPPVRERWLLKALIELLELGPGDRPEWLWELVRDLSGTDTPAGRRYPCPCCDCLTLRKPPTGTQQICRVCWWEDDAGQYIDIEMKPGANKMSLREARDNFLSRGVSDPARAAWARPARAEEKP